MIVDDKSDPPVIPGGYERDEEEQVRHLHDMLAIYEAEDVDSAFWFTFAGFEYTGTAPTRTAILTSPPSESWRSSSMNAAPRTRTWPGSPNRSSTCSPPPTHAPSDGSGRPLIMRIHGRGQPRRASPVILHPGGEGRFYPVADARVLSRRDDRHCQHPAELEVSGVDGRLVSGVDDRLRIRASDHDRQEVVDLLRGALADGRLKMDEFEDRVGLAYQAVTYGDLAPLCADLPAAGAKTGPEEARPALASPDRISQRGVFADLPMTLRVLWTIWLAAVSINVVVWALVSGTTAHLVYPWPLWVAGPYGAALFAVSAGVLQLRHGRAVRRQRVSQVTG